jgi:hypothetical protein
VAAFELPPVTRARVEKGMGAKLPNFLFSFVFDAKKFWRPNPQKTVPDKSGQQEPTDSFLGEEHEQD